MLWEFSQPTVKNTWQFSRAHVIVDNKKLSIFISSQARKAIYGYEDNHECLFIRKH